MTTNTPEEARQAATDAYGRAERRENHEATRLADSLALAVDRGLVTLDPVTAEALGRFLTARTTREAAAAECRSSGAWG